MEVLQVYKWVWYDVIDASKVHESRDQRGCASYAFRFMQCSY